MQAVLDAGLPRLLGKNMVRFNQTDRTISQASIRLSVAILIAMIFHVGGLYLLLTPGQKLVGEQLTRRDVLNVSLPTSHTSLAPALSKPNPTAVSNASKAVVVPAQMIAAQQGHSLKPINDPDLWQSEYSLTSKLQRPPEPLTDIEPVYPEAAGKVQGKVVLKLFIGIDGNVDRALVVYALPEGFFEMAAIDAFSKAKFSPGLLLGKPVKSQMTIEVAFSAFTKY